MREGDSHGVLLTVAEILDAYSNKRELGQSLVRHPLSGEVMRVGEFVAHVKQIRAAESSAAFCFCYTVWGAWWHAALQGLSAQGRTPRVEWCHFLFAEIFLLLFCVLLGVFLAFGVPIIRHLQAADCFWWINTWIIFFLQMLCYLLLLMNCRIAQRLHDCGYGRWWSPFVLLVPPLWLVLCCLPSAAQGGRNAGKLSFSVQPKGVVSALLRCLNESLSWRGRSTRSEFAVGLVLYLFSTAAFLMLFFCLRGGIFDRMASPRVLLLIFLLFSLLLLYVPVPAFVSVSVRRLHDCRLSAWWVVALFFPLTAIPAWLYLLIRPSAAPMPSSEGLSPVSHVPRRRSAPLLRHLPHTFMAALRRWDDYETRTERKAFWPPFLMLHLVLGVSIKGAIAAFLYWDSDYSDFIYAALFLVSLGYVLLLSSLSVRRMHDANLNGAWTFLWFIPFCQLSFLILCLRPSVSPNRYHDDSSWDGAA